MALLVLPTLWSLNALTSRVVSVAVAAVGVVAGLVVGAVVGRVLHTGL